MNIFFFLKEIMKTENEGIAAHYQWLAFQKLKLDRKNISNNTKKMLPYLLLDLLRINNNTSPF